MPVVVERNGGFRVPGLSQPVTFTIINYLYYVLVLRTYLKYFTSYYY